MNLHLDTGKMRPDAVSRTCGKRDRRQSMPTFCILRSKAIWVESVRLLPQIGMALYEVGWNINFGSCRYEILAVPIITQRFTAHRPTGWIQTHGLFDDLSRIAKLG